MGFDPKYQNVSASDLTAYLDLQFQDPGMYDAFKNAWQRRDPRWSFYSDMPNIAFFSF